MKSINMSEVAYGHSSKQQQAQKTQQTQAVHGGGKDDTATKLRGSIVGAAMAATIPLGSDE